MKRKYYAKSFSSKHTWFKAYYSFDSESSRDEWVSHGIEEGQERVACPASEARRYDPIHVRWVSNRNWMNNLTEMAGGWKYG